MIILKNNNLNLEIPFDGKTFMLNNIDYGSGKAEHTTFKGINQIGSYLTASTISERDVAIVGFILADNEKEMKQRKRILYRLTNPIMEFSIIENGYMLTCKANSTVKFASQHEENNNLIAKFVLEVTCFNPCFEPVNPKRVNIALWQGAFHFPLTIPKDKGIIMGLRSPSTIVNVENTGDVQTGVIIEFKAKGSLTAPSLLNVETREFIKINKPMVAGEAITVNTHYGEKSVVSKIDNKECDISGYWDLDSTFLQLKVGDNLLRYDAETNSDNLEIEVRFKPKLLGV